MEVGKLGRSSMDGRLEEVGSIRSADRAKLLATKGKKVNGNEEDQEKQHQKNTRMMKMVQVVYYLTRNGQLEHPHYMEVSHLPTQPLRLKDVMDRLMVLRGKAMPCQYSWSCKRSYKNGYVWNDLSENDVIYASEGSEYVLKGSELLHERDFSEFAEPRIGDQQMKKRQQRKDQQLRTKNMMNKSNATHQAHNDKQQSPKNYERDLSNNYEENYEEEEEEEKGSSNSSNAPCTTTQMEQEESYSLPSTSSTNSDKQPPRTPPGQPPLQPPKTSTSESKRLVKQPPRVVEEDGEPAVSTALTRNNTVLFNLIACGGGGIFENKPKCNAGSRRNFNLMPCLKQQLSSRAATTTQYGHTRLGSGNRAINTSIIQYDPTKVGQGTRANKSQYGPNEVRSESRAISTSNVDQCKISASEEEEEEEDIMMVRYMSENPRFGNLQSEEKEYFSGTILETMAQVHHQHTQSSGSVSGHLHSNLPVLAKSSSYSELRCSNGGLQEEEARVDEEDEKHDTTKFTGLIKLCMPRKKSCSSCSTKHI